MRLQALFLLRTRILEIQGDPFRSSIRRCDLYTGDTLELGNALPAVVIDHSESVVGTEVTCNDVQETLTVELFCAVHAQSRPRERFPNDDQLLALDQVLTDVEVAINGTRNLGVPDKMHATARVDAQPFLAGDQRNVAYGRILVDLVYRYPIGDPTLML